MPTLPRKGLTLRLRPSAPELQQQRSDFGFYRVGRFSGALASAPWPFSTPDRSIVWGTHAQSPLDAPEACCRLDPGYIFARGRAWIAGLYGGKHARTPLGASKANSRLNFGYILARSRDLASAPWPFSAPDRCSIWENARADVLGRCISVLSRTSG